MSKKYPHIFEPFKIGGVEIKNRVVMVAMGIHSKRLTNLDGSYTDDCIDYFVERAKGGTGLIVTGAMQVQNKFEVDHTGGTTIGNAGQPYIDQSRKLTEAVHQYGAKIFVQLTAGTGRNSPFWLCKGEPISASDNMPNVWKPETKHRALTTDEIQMYIDGFANGAKVAKEAGFDGVEIHAIHEGYLLDQFSMACTNTRTDQYGGSLENRLRFAKEILEAIKKTCGQDYPVTVRYSVRSMMKGFNDGALPGEDFTEFGRDLEESAKAAKLLQDMGYDALDSDNGTYDSWYWAHPPVYMPEACNLEDCKYIKQFVDIPVICAGRMENPQFAEDAIAAGEIDAVGLARVLLAEPEWANKVEANCYEDVRPCIACHVGCLGRLFQGKDMCCAVNPAVCREKAYELMPAECKKKIMIVGGGIAGMEAARVSALRGHSVDLYEKTDALGGVFIPASAMNFKEADKRLIGWYERQLQKSGVRVHMNTEATPELIKDTSPDEVIVATGAKTRSLTGVDGADSDHVIYAIEALNRTKPIGDNVVVIGGGLTGIEIAYDLCKEGKTVQVVEMKDKILDMPNLCAANAQMLHQLIKYHDIKVNLSATLTEISADGVCFTSNGEEKTIKADTVIVSIGYISDKALYETLEDMGGNLHLIGDSKEVSNLEGAIWNAYELCMSL